MELLFFEVSKLLPKITRFASAMKSDCQRVSSVDGFSISHVTANTRKW
jgi:hypothetical protein